MSDSTTPSDPPRLVSLDAYRGFVMLAMVSGGLGLAKVAGHFQQSQVWQFLGYQFDHVDWTGCSFWDLIQPSFMFIVGVAMPYSSAKRQSRGDGAANTTAHVLYRAIVLIGLGIFLRSNGHEHTRFTFEDVVTQIGLGYVFLYLLLGRGVRVQAAAMAAILVGYWLLFALWPLPGADFNPTEYGIPDDWQKFTGFAAHWNKHMNPAGYCDRVFLNWLPRPAEFLYNGGGYQTLNFVPSMATMLAGLMTGQFLRGPRSLPDKFKWLLIAGALCLAAGMALDGRIWPGVDWQWSIAPIVKKIWTPSWAVFSTGWTLWLLAAFLGVIDILGYRRWTYPLIVVGMNSVAMYVMSWLLKPWIAGTLRTHLGLDVFGFTYGPIVESVLLTFLLWLVCWWMYRRKVFLRI